MNIAITVFLRKVFIKNSYSVRNNGVLSLKNKKIKKNEKVKLL